MKLHTLIPLNEKTAKRLGQGIGSGRGKTSGRGHKGDKARGSSAWYKAGGSRRSRLIKHMPTVRGLGNLQKGTRNVVITLSKLSANFSANDEVTVDSLVKKGILKKVIPVKVLARGELDKALKISIPVSKTAEEAIVKVGGTLS